MSSPVSPDPNCALVDADETQKMHRHLRSRQAAEMTAETHAGVVPIIDACRQFFAQQRPVFTFKDCKCQAWGIVLIDPEEIKGEYGRLRKALDALERQDSVHRVSDPTSVAWFAVAHEFAHCLQSTECSWRAMKADPVPHEIGADFLAGACIGWHAVDFDVNFLNDIDFAFQLGSYGSTSHPEPHQRMLAISTGVSQGAKANQALAGDLTKINRTQLLACSREATSVVLKGTTRKK